MKVYVLERGGEDDDYPEVDVFFSWEAAQNELQRRNPVRLGTNTWWHISECEVRG